MSIALMTAVWGREDLSSAEKMVLLALADHANDEGMCYPSVGRLSARTALNERTVQRVIRRLCEVGLISIADGAGRSGSNVYWLHLTPGTTPPPAPRHPRHSVTTPPAQCHRPPGTVSPKPSRTIREPRAREASGRSLGHKRGMAERTGPEIATGGGEVLELWAEKIRAGSYVPHSALRPDQVREILARGMATEAQVHAAGLRQ